MSVGRVCLFSLGITFLLGALCFWFSLPFGRLSLLDVALLAMVLGCWSAISSYASLRADAVRDIDYFGPAMPAIALSLIGFGILCLYYHFFGTWEERWFFHADRMTSALFLIGFAIWALVAAFYKPTFLYEEDLSD